MVESGESTGLSFRLMEERKLCGVILFSSITEQISTVVPRYLIGGICSIFVKTCTSVQYTLANIEYLLGLLVASFFKFAILGQPNNGLL